MPGMIQRGASALLVIAVLLVTGVALAFLFYAQPFNDDFHMAVQGRDRGWWGSTLWFYEYLSGRWSGHALIAAAYNVVDPTRSYGRLLVVMTFFHLWGFYAWSRMLLGGSVRTSLVVAIGFFALFWSARPSPDQAMYWFSGSVPYQWSVSLVLLLFAGLARPARPGSARWRSIVSVAGLAALAFTIPGLHELIGLSVCLALATGVFVAYRIGSAGRVKWVFVTLAAVAGLIVVVAAPGNWVRGERYPESGDVLLTLQLCLEDLVKFGPEWVLDVKLLAATAVFALSPGLARHRPAWLDWPGIAWKWILPGLTAVSIFIGFSGLHWAAGRWMPPRMVDPLYCFFLLGWFSSVFVWIQGAGPARVEDSPRASMLRLGACLTLTLALLTTDNAERGLKDLWNERTQAWHLETAGRFELMRRAGRDGVRDLTLERPWARSAILRPLELREDPDYWVNQRVASFFGLETIRLAPREAGARD